MKLRLTLAIDRCRRSAPRRRRKTKPADRMPSYPIEIAPEKVYEYPDLNIARPGPPAELKYGLRGPDLLRAGHYRDRAYRQRKVPLHAQGEQADRRPIPRPC